MTEGTATDPIIFNFSSSDISSDPCTTCDGSDCSGTADGGGDGGSIPTDGCDLDVETMYIQETGEVLYNIPTDIGGFQFNVDGATVLSASGGNAQSAGFVVQASGSTVLGFSFTGSSIPQDCGTLTNLTLSGVPESISGIVVSDAFGTQIDVSYFEVGGSCDDVDVDGICDDVDDCVGAYDECGVCNGYGIADGACDCDGNVDLGWGCGEEGPT